MDELSEKWSSLTDIQQASITELIAGKRQGNIVSSLMQNFDIAREALNSSLNSTGSAQRENEKYLDSIEGRVANLKTSFQELSSVTLDSGFVKGLISGFTQVLDIITTVIDKIGVIPTILSGIGIGAFVKNFGS